MPNNTSPGELENFVSEMIPNDDPVWRLSKDYIDGIPEADRKVYREKDSASQTLRLAGDARGP